MKLCSNIQWRKLCTQNLQPNKIYHKFHINKYMKFFYLYIVYVCCMYVYVYRAGSVFIGGSLITEKFSQAARAHIGLLERD